MPVVHNLRYVRQREPNDKMHAGQRDRRGGRGALVVRIALGLALLAAVWGLADLAYVSVGAETDYAARGSGVQADVIVVLGCHVSEGGRPSRCISSRAGHAATLYNDGRAEWVIATGGETGQGAVESAVLRRVLEEGGVPPEAIIEENRAHNTIQNIRYSSEIMREQGWRTVILVTEPYHINRAALIARDFGLHVYPSPVVDSPNWTKLGPRAYNLARDTLSLMLYQAKSLLGIRD